MSDRVVDQELVERVQAGDKRAFDLLVLKYQRKVQRLVSRFVRDSGEVDDVVQEAFIKAYRALPTFRGDAAFYTWIYRIAINCAKNYLASPGRRIVPMSDLISDDDDDAESFDRNEGLHDVATPDAEYATKQIGETVNRAMAALPEDLRMAVNVSVTQFRHPLFIASVDAVLSESGINPHLLELEITESVAML
ncbi:MAG TPA: sigma-70 family RNA polymerase sigma factor, partial [Casimicrobium sp.]|nr:sigma-70 family RNA polymerase sigma factor [Casimicrobium sp.]